MTFNALGLGIVESDFKPEARSGKKAQGVYQFVERTARSVGLKDRSDPVESAKAATKYTTQLYGQMRDKVERLAKRDGKTKWLENATVGDVYALALLSYNGGPSQIGPITIGELLAGKKLTTTYGESNDYVTRMLGWSKSFKKGVFPENSGANKAKSDRVLKLLELNGIDVERLEETFNKKAFN